jgi:ADP-ribosyl-[dinitrogen reductase] hydrolase
MDLASRYRGCLLGLAVGDALGTTLEFKSPGTFEPITDMIGGGPFRLQPGQWTDDTSMALCLAESLLEKRGHDPKHQLETYIRWYRHGHLSSTGRCFDIGNTTRAALHTFEDTGREYPGPTHESGAGNGSLMRLAPVPMFWRRNPREALLNAAQTSRTTHGAWECIDACRYYTALILGAFAGLEKGDILRNHFLKLSEINTQLPLAPKITAIAMGSYQYSEPPEIKGTGYVVCSLEAALWAFHKSTNFEDGALLAVNLGNDADTTGAIYGQLAGAYYGEAGIPEIWRSKLAMSNTISAFADRILNLSESVAP